jgi:large subunit ribosomal protein L10
MAITRQKKEEVVAKVTDSIKKAKTLVFANFKGLTVAEQNEMRKALRAAKVSYIVAKKTLIKRALETGAYAGTLPELDGEIAIVAGEDEIAPAREIATYVKKFTDHLSFAGGVFGGKYVSREEIVAIAAIPSMETLRAMFAQIISSPRQRFAVVLGEVAKTKN